MLANIQVEIPTENQNTNEETPSQENFSSNSYSSRKKSISIYGRAGVGKTTLADILKNKAAQIARRYLQDSELLRVSNFKEIENFIRGY